MSKSTATKKINTSKVTKNGPRLNCKICGEQYQIGQWYAYSRGVALGHADCVINQTKEAN